MRVCGWSQREAATWAGVCVWDTAWGVIGAWKWPLCSGRGFRMSPCVAVLLAFLLSSPFIPWLSSRSPNTVEQQGAESASPVFLPVVPSTILQLPQQPCLEPNSGSERAITCSWAQSQQGASHSLSPEAGDSTRHAVCSSLGQAGCALPRVPGCWTLARQGELQSEGRGPGLSGRAQPLMGSPALISF